MWRNNYWKEQEIFAINILKHILWNLIKKNFYVDTYTWKYYLIWINDFWTPEWWEQLTDKILVLKYKRNNNEIIDSYFFIESKAYLKWASDESVNWSFEMFENKLPQFWNIWYASSYVIFRWLENKSTYYLIKKRIEEDEKLPDHYFEIDKSDFLNDNRENKLTELYEKVKSEKEDIKKLNLIDEYINNNQYIIVNLERKIEIEIKQWFTKYEWSEKRLDSVLKNRNNIDKTWINWIEIEDYKKWFYFDDIENSEDLEKAKKDQESYLINKYHYFDNPLIKENIENIEDFICKNTFIELHEKDYNNLSLCTNEFLEEMKEVEFTNKHQKKIKDYLFEWWKKQKRWFLFDSWAKEKILLHYKKNNSITFINKIKDE